MNFRIEYNNDTPKKKEYNLIRDKRVSITGILPNMTRAEAKKWLKARGAIYSENVTKHVDILIKGKPRYITHTASKEKLARQYNIPVFNVDAILGKNSR